MGQWSEERGARQPSMPRLLLQVELSHWLEGMKWVALFVICQAGVPWDQTTLPVCRATSADQCSGNLEAVKGDQISSYCPTVFDQVQKKKQNRNRNGDIASYVHLSPRELAQEKGSKESWMGQGEKKDLNTYVGVARH